jgi:glycosyltransferase involved in cell wall biosynthesis
MIKILHIPFTYYPDPVGGTEIYVESLTRELFLFGINSVIAAPGNHVPPYFHSNVKVNRFSSNAKIKNLKDMYGPGDCVSVDEFDRILLHEKPDIVHIHAHSPSISLNLVRRIKYRKMPVLFTYHTPTVTCQRGTMLYWGELPCNGLMDPVKCTECSLHGKGLNKNAAQVLARLPKHVRNIFDYLGLRGGIWTALRLRNLISLRISITKQFLGEMNHIIAVCNWVKLVLLENGIPEDKITLCRQELTQALRNPENQENSPVFLKKPTQNKQLKLVYLGRIDPDKGIEVLLKAVSIIPNCNLILDIYGIAQGESGISLYNKLRILYSNDKRVSFKNPIKSSASVQTIKEYDILVVPSQIMETGPLVVLEGLAAGITVIGSNLGGIKELINDGITGYLFEAGNPKHLSEIILKAKSNLIQKNTYFENLKERRMTKEIVKIYNNILKSK